MDLFLAYLWILSLLEAHLLCNYIDVTDLLPHGKFSSLGHISVVCLFVDLFGRSFQFCQAESYKDAISKKKPKKQQHLLHEI